MKNSQSDRTEYELSIHRKSDSSIIASRSYVVTAENSDAMFDRVQKDWNDLKAAFKNTDFQVVLHSIDRATVFEMGRW